MCCECLPVSWPQKWMEKRIYPNDKYIWSRCVGNYWFKHFNCWDVAEKSAIVARRESEAEWEVAGEGERGYIEEWVYDEPACTCLGSTPKLLTLIQTSPLFRLSSQVKNLRSLQVHSPLTKLQATRLCTWAHQPHPKPIKTMNSFKPWICFNRILILSNRSLIQE